jgi:hypothetical protein
MTDESAKELADAMNRLAAAIESVRGQGLMNSIQVHHTGIPYPLPPCQQPWPQPYGPQWGTWCGTSNLGTTGGQ